MSQEPEPTPERVACALSAHQPDWRDADEWQARPDAKRPSDRFVLSENYCQRCGTVLATFVLQVNASGQLQMVWNDDDAVRRRFAKP